MIKTNETKKLSKEECVFAVVKESGMSWEHGRRTGKVPDKMRSRGGEGAIVKELRKAGDVRQSLYTIQEAITSDVDGSCERSCRQRSVRSG